MTKRTKNSGSKLSDLARHVILPDGIVTTGWPQARAQLQKLGIPLDGWQEGFLTAALGKRADGVYAAGIGGVVASIPRQVGKTHMVGALVFAVAMMQPGALILWTAHRTRTHAETFSSMIGWAQRPEIKSFVSNIRRANGEQAITFANGSRILFGARENGFGRGFAKVDVLIFDEAQILSTRALEDMIPATNAADNGLVFMMGTPPRPGDPGEAFTLRREAALSGDDPDVLYVEFSADEGASPDDRAQWRKANPSFPHRTSEGAILRMRKLLGSADSFRREGLGIWDRREVGRRAFPAGLWDSRVGDPPDSGVRAFGVKFSADGSHMALAGAVRSPDGRIHVEGIRQAPMADGTQWLVDFLVERKDNVAQIVIDGKSGVGYLVNALRDERVGRKTIIVPTVDEAIQAHSMLDRAVVQGEMSHGGQAELDAQVNGALRRAIGRSGGFGWAPAEPDGSVTLFDAVTLAHWAARVSRRDPSRRQTFL